MKHKVRVFEETAGARNIYISVGKHEVLRKQLGSLMMTHEDTWLATCGREGREEGGG